MWGRCECWAALTLSCSLLPKPGHSACFWGLDVVFSALLSILRCYDLQWEGRFKPHWTEEPSSWIWDKAQAPWHFLCDR